jgi:hypothetical protein
MRSSCHIFGAGVGHELRLFAGGRRERHSIPLRPTVYHFQTVPSPAPLRRLLKKQMRPLSAEIPEPDVAERPYPLRRLMTRRVVVLAVINYGTLSLVEVSYVAIQPLFFSTPVNRGGLGLDPPAIGKILACFGILNSIFQFTCFSRANALWDTKRVFIGGLLCAIPVYVLFPVMNVLARAYGVGQTVYSTIALQVIFGCGLSLCHGILSLPLVIEWH